VASVRLTRPAVSLSVAGVLALVSALFWFVTQHEDLLPVTYVSSGHLSLFRHVIGAWWYLR
jgi:hypothetical protein